ncbi:MAG: nucleoside triphosphate pyrophosphohydrolase [Chromatiales bacterium]|nr:nucleoside triphosphate pyrophosphohydrolase [Chromatiales bacterium]
MKSTADIDTLLGIMARLRDPEGGCPWDLQQTFDTIAPYTIEEAYEVAEAIRRGDRGDLRDELGDLLFQVVFHARMAEEEGGFAFADVVQSIVDKMIRRHPHVFSDATVTDAEDQTRAWEVHKAAERAGLPDDSLMAGVTLGLPGLTRAEKLQRRAARVGFDWPDVQGVLAKLREEAGELEEAVLQAQGRDRAEEELGDILFTCANLARHLGVDAEAAIRGANTRFEQRFRAVEFALKAMGSSPQQADLATMDALWNQAKKTTGNA